MTRRTGVIYDLPLREDGDLVHIETCGWDDYIIFTKSKKHPTYNNLVSISRKDARELVQEWMKHIEESDDQDVLDSLEDEE